MRSLRSAKSHTAAPNEKLICLFVFYLLHTMANRNFVSWTHEPKFSYRASWVWAQTWNDFALPAHFAGSKFEFQATWSLDLLTICTVFEVLLVVELTKPMLALSKEFQWNSQKFMKHIEGFIGSVHNVNFTHSSNEFQSITADKPFSASPKSIYALPAWNFQVERPLFNSRDSSC